MPRNWAKLSKYIGEGRSISQLLLGLHVSNFLEVAETHMKISRSLGKFCHTCGQSSSTQNLGQVEKICGGLGRSISQLLLGPHAPNTFWRLLRHIGTFLDHLGSVLTAVGRVPVPQTGPS